MVKYMVKTSLLLFCSKNMAPFLGESQTRLCNPLSELLQRFKEPGISWTSTYPVGGHRTLQELLGLW
jgi:hypothetical protein